MTICLDAAAAVAGVANSIQRLYVSASVRPVRPAGRSDV